ncbi:unnamed protein product [Rotaria socialis]|uniref:Uncharacterized protein n=1 Tax=Rotaria socialis TaxID=392032 RepID=A0A818TYM0_9BILA|nr:unnamed protein product [Rotaria socialis]CAF4484207.1 unnamed protein product [Rotaria socialis]
MCVRFILLNSLPTILNPEDELPHVVRCENIEQVPVLLNSSSECHKILVCRPKRLEPLPGYLTDISLHQVFVHDTFTDTQGVATEIEAYEDEQRIHDLLFLATIAYCDNLRKRYNQRNEHGLVNLLLNEIDRLLERLKAPQKKLFKVNY